MTMAFKPIRIRNTPQHHSLNIAANDFRALNANCDRTMSGTFIDCVPQPVAPSADGSGVMTNPVTVYNIYYGASWSAADMRYVDNFVANIGAHPWCVILKLF